ncbi:MAG TPA: exodeoxyribonuclease VII large subunit, partial [Desulfomicrobiaceae bacterium]|nr:exodeoxyribonuclease VII large subunit [Desulfomicrobiaceae bacterium]
MVHVFGVSELTSALRSVLEGEFPFVWVRGPAGDVSRPPSGHVYFSVRDGESVLPG